MTAATLTGPDAPVLRVTQSGVLRSEWTKLRSLRSTLWTLGVAAVLMVGLAAVIGLVTADQYAGWEPAEQAAFSAVGSSLAGITFAQLAIGVLGVLLVTGEYATGTIRATLTAVPRRLPVLWAKLGVYATVVLVLGLLMSLASFLVTQPLLDEAGLGAALSDDGVASALLGGAGYLVLVAVMSVSLGALLRSTAGGISAVVGLFFLLQILANLLPSSLADAVTPYLPANAGAAVYGATMTVDDPLTAGAGALVLCGYAVVLVAAAAWRLQRTDA